MTLYPESYEVLNKIITKSGLNAEALSLMGINQGKINDAIHQCRSSGMTRTQAAKTVYNLWAKANPNVQSSPPTAKEMTMMGFYKTPQGTWKHSIVTTLEISIEMAKQLSFTEIEQMVFKEAADQTKGG